MQLAFSRRAARPPSCGPTFPWPPPVTLPSALSRRDVFLWSSHTWSFSAFGRWSCPRVHTLLKCWLWKEPSLGSIISRFIALVSLRYRGTEPAEHAVSLSSPLLSPFVVTTRGTSIVSQPLCIHYLMLPICVPREVVPVGSRWRC